MATYTITHPITGQKITLTGDTPPSPEALKQIFAATGPKQPVQSQQYVNPDRIPKSIPETQSTQSIPYGQNLGNFFTKDIPDVVKSRVGKWQQAYTAPTAAMGMATNPAAQQGGGPLSNLVSVPERTVYGLGQGIGTAFDVGGLALSGVNKLLGSAPGNLYQKWFQSPPGQQLQQLGKKIGQGPIGTAMQPITNPQTPEGQARLEAAKNFAMLAGPKTGGMGTEAVGKSMIESAEAATPKNLVAATTKLFEKAPADVKGKLPGLIDPAGREVVTNPAKIEALTNEIKRFGLQEYVTNGPVLEQKADDLISKVNQKAEETITLLPKLAEELQGSISPLHRELGSHIEKNTQINPWKVAEDAITAEKAKGTLGLFSEDADRYNKTFERLKTAWEPEWNQDMSPMDVMKFKRDVINKKNDVFKKIDEVDPSEKPEINIKKLMYFGINDALSGLPHGEKFISLNQDLKSLFLIRDAASNLKQTAKGGGLTGAMIGAGVGGATGAILHAVPGLGPVAPTMSLLGAAAGSYFGQKIQPRWPTYPIRGNIGRGLIGAGQLMQGQIPNAPLSTMDEYLRNVDDASANEFWQKTRQEVMDLTRSYGYGP